MSWEESPRNGRTEAWSHLTKTNTIARQIPAQSMSSCKETVSSSSSNLKLFDRPSLSHSIKVVSQFQHHANGFRQLQFKIFDLVRLQRRRGATYCLCQQSIPLMLHATITNHICSGLSGVKTPMRTLIDEVAIQAIYIDARQVCQSVTIPGKSLESLGVLSESQGFAMGSYLSTKPFTETTSRWK